MSMLCTARRMSDLNPSLRLPEESLRELLEQRRLRTGTEAPYYGRFHRWRRGQTTP